LSTIYSELLVAAGTEFIPQADGEPDSHYLRRLVLAVSKASDNDWERLSKEAQDWYNAQAKRVKAQQDPEECPGFNPQMIVVDEASSIPKIVDAVVDAGWPTGPELPKSSSNDVAHQDSPHIVSGSIPLETDGEIVSLGALYDAVDAFVVHSPKHTATDAVRALVMLHDDWNQAQIMREL